MTTYVNSCISKSATWEPCFRYFLNRADVFEVVFQGSVNTPGDDLLNSGKSEFVALNNTIISPNLSMENSFILSGKLTQEVKDLFIEKVCRSFNGYRSDLWSFCLYIGDRKVLSVEDFSTCFLYLDDNDENQLKEFGLDLSGFDRLKQPDPDEGRTVLPITPDEAVVLGDAVKDLFE